MGGSTEKEPICWRRLPEFVPGRVGLCSDALDWKNIALRSYHYEGQDVIVPAMREFLLVGYRAGVTPMQRRFDGRWSRETLAPGAASFLTRAQAAHWTWDEPVEVTHIYLSADLMTEVASEMYDRCVDEVALRDVLRTTDPVVSHAMTVLGAEAQAAGLGGALYVDAVSRGLIVHLLRNYATVRTREADAKGALTVSQQRRIRGYIEEHLSEPLDLARLAGTLSMTPCLFARHFKASFGVPPYAYVMDRRLTQAQALLRRPAVPIKQIAADCGFADQAHLTRLFRREYGVPPAQYRQGHA
ncbi:helix-turn-helix domain-containing protein [Paracoccus jiaweipingae]|uniref:helix-turn-helix domain-containing protein n=1 Tax=unclassified Paracoccus (in: a-proteobacteria) TaxID=2688777 RepID=UPI0037A5E9B2